MRKTIALLLFSLLFIPAKISAYQDLPIDGRIYTFPDVDDENWGQDVTDWAVAISSAVQKRPTITAVSNSTSTLFAHDATYNISSQTFAAHDRSYSASTQAFALFIATAMLDANNTNYINNSDSLQAGSKFHVVSASITGKSVFGSAIEINASSITSTAGNFNTTDNALCMKGQDNSCGNLIFTAGNGKNNQNAGSIYIKGGSNNSAHTNTAGSVYINGGDNANLPNRKSGRIIVGGNGTGTGGGVTIYGGDTDDVTSAAGGIELRPGKNSNTASNNAVVKVFGPVYVDSMTSYGSILTTTSLQIGKQSTVTFGGASGYVQSSGAASGQSLTWDNVDGGRWIFGTPPTGGAVVASGVSITSFPITLSIPSDYDVPAASSITFGGLDSYTCDSSTRTFYDYEFEINPATPCVWVGIAYSTITDLTPISTWTYITPQIEISSVNAANVGGNRYVKVIFPTPFVLYPRQRIALHVFRTENNGLAQTPATGLKCTLHAWRKPDGQ